MAENDSRPSSGVSLRRFGAEGLLFDESSQSLFALDADQAETWSALWIQGVSRHVAVARLSKRLTCSPKAAEGYVADCLRLWGEHGFIGRTTSPKPAQERAVPVAVSRKSGHELQCFRAAGTDFGIRCPDPEAAEAIGAILGHLQVGERSEVAFTIEIDKTRHGYVLAGIDGVPHELPAGDAVAVMLKNEIAERLSYARPTTIVLHAAALATERGAILLAGSSGSGKTTLAATLNRHHKLLADDIVFLDAANVRVQGLSFAFALKPGSWPLLEPHYPPLAATKVRVRPDGNLVKYLWPDAADQNANVPVAAIVFPRFTPGAQARPHPLEGVPTVVRLLDEARNAARRLSQQGFAAICEMVAGADVYDLVFGDLQRAARIVTGRCRE